MPALPQQFLLKLNSDYKQYPVFIETGTLFGETIFAMEPLFDELFTIEIKQQFYDKLKNYYKGNKINFYLGDSSDVLKEILPGIDKDAIIFLDGHWSMGGTGRGKKDCPLTEEIINISKLFKNKAIVIIDDYRLFGKKTGEKEKCDWTDITKESLLKILGNRVSDVYHLPSRLTEDDRLIIHINSL